MLFRSEAFEHRRRRLWGDVRLAQPPSMTMWTLLLGGASLVIIGGLTFGTYVRKETVPGYLAPEGGIVQVITQRGGQITAVHVQEGQHVRAGDPLIDISGETVGASTGRVLEAQLAETQRQIQNVRQSYAANLDSLGVEGARLNAQIRSQQDLKGILSRRLAEQQQVVDISRSQLEKYQQLAKNGFASQLQIDQLRQQVLAQQGMISEIQQSLASVDANVSDNRMLLAALPARANVEGASMRSDISQLEQRRIDLSAAQSSVERAPVDGIISSLQAEVGQSPTANTALISIMPDGAILQAEVLMPTRAAGLIKAGDGVRLQIDAYPFQRFGFVTGHVTSISKSVLQPSTFLAPISFKEAVYRVRVSLDRTSIDVYGMPHPLRPGMSLSADIITDRRPLWRQVFDPLLAAGKKLQ